MISRHLWLSLLMSASLFVVVFALAFSLASAAQAATWETHMDAGDKAYQQGNYIEAEKQVLAALKKAEAFGPQDPRLGIILNALADVYRSQGRYAEAKPLYKRALMIQEKTLGADDPLVATTLNNLAVLYDDQGRYAEAELLHKRALAIRQKAYGQTHPDVANSLHNLASLYQEQGKYAEAEVLYKQTLRTSEKALDADDPHLANTLGPGLALLQAGPVRRGEAALQAGLENS